VPMAQRALQVPLARLAPKGIRVPRATREHLVQPDHKATLVPREIRERPGPLEQPVRLA
jgi:hypothetical protein